MARWSFRTQLLVLVVALLLPLGAAVSWLAYHNMQNSVNAAKQSTLELARRVAVNYGQFLLNNELILQRLAERPQIRALNPARCDPQLQNFMDILPMFINLSVLARDGELICSVVPGKLTLARDPWFEAMRDFPGLFVTEPFMGRLLPRWVMLLSYPVRDNHDGISGRVNLTVNMARLQEVMQGLAIPPDTVLSLVSAKGALLARIPPLPDRVGGRVRDSDIVSRELADAEGVAEATEPDGVEQIYGFARVEETGWYVHAVIPSNVVLGPVFRSIWQSVAAYLTGATLLGLFIGALYRRTDRNLAALGQVARAVEHGDRSARFSDSGPRELRSIVRALNDMLVAQARAETALRQSEQQQRNMVKTLETKHAQLAQVQRIAGIGSWELDLHSGVLSWSDEICRMFGTDPARLGASLEAFVAFVHPDDRARVGIVKAEAIGNNTPYAIDYRILPGGGGVKFVHEQSEDFYDDEGRPLRRLGAVYDITSHKRAEETLRESEQRFRQLAENISEVFWFADPGENRFLYISPAYEKIWGRSCESLYQSPETWIEAIHAEDRERIRLASATRQLRGGYDETYRIVQPGGDLRWIHVCAYAVRNERGEVYRVVGIAEDVTEKQLAQRQLEESFKRLQSLSRRLTEVREDEWQRLSTELHDRIGQNLAALSINLKIITDRLRPEPAAPLSALLGDSRILLEATIASVRDLISELRPPALADYGLLAGLRGYCKQLQLRTGIAIQVKGDEPKPRLPPVTENALFRIAQEALINVVKHAQAQDVRVKLVAAPGRVLLSVQDDGRGFDSAKLLHNGRHWGLAIMQERAEAVGALLRMESTPGHGTRVTVEVRRKS